MFSVTSVCLSVHGGWGRGGRAPQVTTTYDAIVSWGLSWPVQTRFTCDYLLLPHGHFCCQKGGWPSTERPSIGHLNRQCQHKWLFLRMHENIWVFHSGGSRISPRFGRGEVPTPKMEVKKLSFGQFVYKKVHEIERIWTLGARPWRPLIRRCSTISISIGSYAEWNCS